MRTLQFFSLPPQGPDVKLLETRRWVGGESSKNTIEEKKITKNFVVEVKEEVVVVLVGRKATETRNRSERSFEQDAGRQRPPLLRLFRLFPFVRVRTARTEG